MSNDQKGPGQGPQPPSWKHGLAGVAVALTVMWVFNQNAQKPEIKTSGIPYSELDQKAKQRQIKDATIKRDGTIVGKMADGTPFQSTVPPGDNAYGRLRDSGAVLTGEDPPEPPNGVLTMLGNWGPMLLLIAVWIFFMKKMQGGGGVMGFSKAKYKQEIPDVKFDDVAGIDEAKEDCEELVEFLKNPRKFSKLGGRIPRGILMVGPPGTGKTLTARAIAGEAQVPFFSISGSDFVEMFVGVGASRVRDLFDAAKKQAPSIIFIDEIDAIGRQRGQAMNGSNDEREQTLNQMLVEMDGFSGDTGVIVIAATNRADILDKALIRPGRFDRQVNVSLPDLVGREKILKVHSKKVSLAPDVDTKMLAIGTPQFSGADLANLVNEAALRAARLGKTAVTMADFEFAKDKVMMGPERKTYTMSEAERRLTAYHEAGHAFVALNEPTSDPIYKASIIPRGGALGYVVRMPEADRVSLSEARLHGDMAVAMGGRAAEEIFFGKDMRTTGASGDFDMATAYAEKMVTEWGMSSLGPRRFTDRQQTLAGQFGNISEDLMKQIDAEIDAILDRAYKKASTLISENKDKIGLLAETLLKYDTLTGDEIKAVIDGQNLDVYRAGAGERLKAAKANDNTAPVTKPDNWPFPRRS